VEILPDQWPRRQTARPLHGQATEEPVALISPPLSVPTRPVSAPSSSSSSVAVPSTASALDDQGAIDSFVTGIDEALHKNDWGTDSLHIRAPSITSGAKAFIYALQRCFDVVRLPTLPADAEIVFFDFENIINGARTWEMCVYIL